MQNQISAENLPALGMCRHKWSASFHGNSTPEKCLYCTVTDLKTSEWLDAESLQVKETNAFIEDLKNGGKIPLIGFIFRIGRLDTNQIVVQDDSVSRSHAVITCEDDKFFVQDLGSTNGTLLNGSPLRHRERLTDRDIIRTGQIQFEFSCKTSISHVLSSSFAPAG